MSRLNLKSTSSQNAVKIARSPGPKRDLDWRFPEGIPKKAADYCLNLHHAGDGAIKAQEFRDLLGLTLGNKSLFIQRIYSGVRNNPATYAKLTTDSQHHKWEVSFLMKHATAAYRHPVVTVWKDNDGHPKIITAYCKTPRSAKIVSGGDVSSTNRPQR